MQTTYEPMTARQRKELQGYASRWIAVARVTLYLIAVLFVGASLRSVHAAFGKPHQLLASDVWWILPAIAFAIWLARASRKWTGGRQGAAEIKADLANGRVAVHRIVTADAIEVEEQEDEGPSFFVLTSDREVLFFHGQELDASKRRGFPWREFEIVETPLSRMLFRLRKRGAPFRPSYLRKPLTYEDIKEFSGNFKGHYRVLAHDFESLKTGGRDVRE